MTGQLPARPTEPTPGLSVLVDGTVTEPRLDHPEGLAVHPVDGSIWCGGERGQIYRIDPQCREWEVVGSTGGFCLGMAFDHDQALFVCDLAHAAVYRLDPQTGQLEMFADGVPGHRFRIPNFPLVDPQGNLYVSDSHGEEPGPGIARFAKDGSGTMWHPGPFAFANGLALSPSADRLFVAETRGSAITAIDINGDGTPGPAEQLAHLPGILPDGLAVATDGSLVVACYEPSMILGVRPDREVEVLAADPTAHLLCHPTNVAFHQGRLLCSNLGRWHLTSITCELTGLAIPPQRGSAEPVDHGTTGDHCRLS